MADNDLDRCPKCSKPYDQQGGPSLVSDVETDRRLCRVCQLTLERDAYRDQEVQPEDRWEPFLTPEGKVQLTLTGINLDDLKTACILAATGTRDMDALAVSSQEQRWKKLAHWMTAVVNKGPADAGGCLNDFSG